MTKDSKFPVFSQTLHELLKSRGMTQKDFAAKVGVKGSSANAWFKGTSMPESARLLEIAKAFDLTMEATQLLVSIGYAESADAPVGRIDKLVDDFRAVEQYNSYQRAKDHLYEESTPDRDFVIAEDTPDYPDLDYLQDLPMQFRARNKKTGDVRYLSGKKHVKTSGHPPEIKIADKQVVAGTKDLPVLGGAVGGRNGFFELNGSPNEYINRPSSLAGVADAYAVYVYGDSMEPKYQEGQLLFVHPHKPTRIGDFVVVQLTENRALVKRLAKKDSEALLLLQFNPEDTLRFFLNEVVSVHKIVGTEEAG